MTSEMSKYVEKKRSNKILKKYVLYRINNRKDNKIQKNSFNINKKHIESKLTEYVF